jgi:hypothetical protein
MMCSEGHGVRVHLEHEMDTFTVELAKNTPARGGKRRMRTLQEKRRIVEEVLRGGESVAVIARTRSEREPGVQLEATVREGTAPAERHGAGSGQSPQARHHTRTIASHTWDTHRFLVAPVLTGTRTNCKARLMRVPG